MASSEALFRSFRINMKEGLGEPITILNPDYARRHMLALKFTSIILCGVENMSYATQHFFIIILL